MHPQHLLEHLQSAPDIGAANSDFMRRVSAIPAVILDDHLDEVASLLHGVAVGISSGSSPQASPSLRPGEFVRNLIVTPETFPPGEDFFV